MSRGSVALVFACCLACDADASEVNEAQRPDAATARPDAAEPDAAHSTADASSGNAGRPDATHSPADASSGDAAQPDAAHPPAGASNGDAAQPDAAELDAAPPDAAQPDAATPSATDGDAGAPAVPMDAGEELDSGAVTAPVRIQVFSRTVGFRHDSIEPARDALIAMAARRNATLESTEDPALLIPRLATADVVVFLMTTGDVLDAGQQAAFEAFIRAGGGFVGVHSSADTEYDWPFYRELNGAWFQDHPAIQPAKIIVDAPDDPLVMFLPPEWMRSDEWYNFRDNPRGRVKVLLRLDESTYSGGSMGAATRA